MRTKGTTDEDCATSGLPSIECNHPDDVAEVRVLDGFRLLVRFNDGLQGEVKMDRLVHSPAAGVFAQLADPGLFAEAAVAFGTVVWSGGLDLAPDVMYEEIQRSGRWEIE